MADEDAEDVDRYINGGGTATKISPMSSNGSVREVYQDDAPEQYEPVSPFSAASDASIPPSSGSAPLSDTPSSSASPVSPTSSVPLTPASPRTPRAKKKKSVHFKGKQRLVAPRTRAQSVIRVLSLYLVPAVLAVPTSLLVSLTTIILTPLYNTYPLTLHTPILYGILTLTLGFTYWSLTIGGSAQDRLSARVCLNISALAGDAVVVAGRRVGSMSGLLGPEWGALTARVILGVGIAGGVGGFSLLCSDHVFAISPATSKVRGVISLINIMIRSAIYIAHIYTLDRLWTRLLSGSTSYLVQSPEKSILCISLLLTGVSLLFHSPSGSMPIPKTIHSSISRRFKLSSRGTRKLSTFTSLLPSQIFPILLLLRIPLLILALRQQLFLRPHPPYFAAHGTLQVLSSERGITGQIVVAENLERNYRFLRCDASILGGRWIRQSSENSSENNGTTIMGESIFAAFPMQEIGALAYRSDASESLMRTIALTTEALVIPEAEEDEENKPQERALIIGLGIGVTASSFSKRGLSLDLVELDPVVYRAAVNHFDLVSTTEDDTINLIDGSAYISELSRINVEMEGQLQKWSYVVHDCFTGGGVPGDVYTREFWDQLKGLVEDDGIVAVNVAAVVGSMASRAIIITLLSAFTQCRAFNEPSRQKTEMMNMVILCTMTHSPLLTFRPPTQVDVQRSRLRSHIYTTFHQNEVSLDSLVFASDWEDPRLLLRRNSSHGLDEWQGESSFATWRAMQDLLSREMWMAW